ncbi:MAG: HAMP domain-containing sensor histidine kinase [Eubacteriales bacterium]|nr:HAMP domain-containing sensor histidine kinase [Eubacteriales bacterium]
MLKKLRLKFVLINMTIVTIMLGVIFGLLYVSTSRNLEQESMRMMEAVVRDPRQMRPPGNHFPDVRLPFFSFIVDEDGNITETEGDFFDLSDEEVMKEFVRLTAEVQNKSGVLKDYNLRFISAETPKGQRIIFTDISSEQSTLSHLIKMFAMTGSAAFLAFLVISILLSYWAVSPVDKAWKQQKQFVADASHELKTPLTVIMTDAELLSAPECTGSEKDKLSGSILSMSRQMRGLVESLLELARIDNGSIKKEPVRVSFSEIASESAMLFEPVFFERAMPFSYDIDPEIMVKGDPEHLKQLTGILLDNAQKYASPGGETKLLLKKNSQRSCLLTVSNQGDALEKEELKNIFKRFYRADKARAMNQSYGLGLSIAQSVAEEHRGKIRAESKDGWNIFTVELPVC